MTFCNQILVNSQYPTEDNWHEELILEVFKDKKQTIVRDKGFKGFPSKK